MNRIFSIFLVLTIGLVLGCTSEVNSPDIKLDAQIMTGYWQVEDIDQGGVIDNALVFLQFEDDNRIVGSTGCNRFFGTINTLSNTFSASQVATTLMACPPAISEQEQRFLAALNDAVRYEIQENTWLIVYDAANKPRLKLIKMEPQPESSNTEIIR